MADILLVKMCTHFILTFILLTISWIETNVVLVININGIIFIIGKFRAKYLKK